MNRRDLLKLLISSPIAATLDVEKLLWVKEKIIFIPSHTEKYIYIPSPRQVQFFEAFLGGMAGGGKTLRMKELIKKYSLRVRE